MVSCNQVQNTMEVLMLAQFKSMVAAAALLLGAIPVQAVPVEAAPVRYEAAFVFGDSLSDPGNFYDRTRRLTGIGFPRSPYFEGRSSNGPVWAEYLAEDFTAAGLPFYNYAQSLGQVVSPRWPDPTDYASLLPINLRDQLRRFSRDAADGVPSASLAFVLMGANDAFNIIDNASGRLGRGNEEAIKAQAVAAAGQVAAALVDSLSVLVPAGVRDLFLMNLPDLGKVPLYADTQASAVASLVSDAFNQGLFAGNFDGLNVRPFDLAQLFTNLMLAPEDFGVTSLEPCFNPARSSRPCDDPDTRAFFDQVHPSATIHARLAAEVREAVAPVPLPASVWMLLAGLLALGAAGRRARA
jgi:phospholipase/lecithinase/hemolysin